MILVDLRKRQKKKIKKSKWGILALQVQKLLI